MKELDPKEQIHFLRAVKKLPASEGMILLFAFETGVRLSEALEVRVDQVRGRNSVWIVTRKRREEYHREIPISSRLQKYLKVYLKYFAQESDPKKNPEGHLFFSKKKTPFSPRYVQHFTLKLMNSLGFNHPEKRKDGSLRSKGRNFHSLRHTFGRNLVRRGVPLQTIQYLMGHRYISSTGIYLGPSREEIFKAVA